MQHLLSHTDVKPYVLAGNATFTLQSGETNEHFTYKMVRDKNNADLYRVRLLSGDDNTSDYNYVGCYYRSTSHLHLLSIWRTKPSWANPPAIRAITYFLQHLDNLPRNLYVYHTGRCARCGRLLTTPDSLISGYGPQCREAL